MELLKSIGEGAKQLDPIPNLNPAHSGRQSGRRKIVRGTDLIVSNLFALEMYVEDSQLRNLSKVDSRLGSRSQQLLEASGSFSSTPAVTFNCSTRYGKTTIKCQDCVKSVRVYDEYGISCNLHGEVRGDKSRAFSPTG